MSKLTILSPHFLLPCSMPNHTFNEDSISSGGILYQDMGYRSDNLSVLDNGTAAHGCVKIRAKNFFNF